jgi:hypothetical protein
MDVKGSFFFYFVVLCSFEKSFRSIPAAVSSDIIKDDFVALSSALHVGFNFPVENGSLI